MKIIIAAPGYETKWGGIITLHKLCHVLNEVGFDSYMINYTGNGKGINLNPDFNTTNITIEQVDRENDIMVYPEIVAGNPYKMKKCVRYILFFNKVRNTYQTWDKNDFWIYFTEAFYDEMKPKNILSMFDTKVDFYRDLGKERENKSCYSKRKIADYDHVSKEYHEEDSVFIGNDTSNPQEYLNLFNKYKRFYNYDNDSYTNTIAALCGCETIIVPVNGISAEEFKRKQPTQRYGVCYGLEDIENSKNVDKLREDLINQEKNQLIQTNDMFDKIIDYFNHG